MSSSTDGMAIQNSCVHNILFPFLPAKIQLGSNTFSKINSSAAFRRLQELQGILLKEKLLHA